jgi:hypothetical protein
LLLPAPVPGLVNYRFSFCCDRDGRTRTFTAAAADTGRGFPDSTDTEPDHVVDDVDAADTGRGFPDSTETKNFPGVESPLIGLPSTSVRPRGASDGCPGRDDFFDRDPWVTVTWPKYVSLRLGMSVTEFVAGSYTAARSGTDSEEME